MFSESQAPTSKARRLHCQDTTWAVSAQLKDWHFKVGPMLWGEQENERPLLKHPLSAYVYYVVPFSFKHSAI